MKKWTSTTKVLSLVSVIFALTITGLAFYFYTKVKWASQLMTFENADPDFVESILSFSARSISFLIPLICLAIVFIAQYIIAAWFIVKGKTKQEKIFGYLTLIVGGLIFSPLYLLYLFFKSKNKEVKAKKVASWKVVTTSIVTPIVAVAPIIPLAMYKGLDKPTSVENVKYSTASDKPNVIEIFTDGFDPELIGKEIKNDATFKDFTVFDKFVVAGAETQYSFPMLMNGLQENIYKHYDEEAHTPGGSMTDVFASTFGRTINEHIGKDADYAKPYLVNIAGVVNGAYMASYSGDPKLVAHINPNIQAVNWGQAKDDVAGSFGINPYSSDSVYYEWMHRKQVIDNAAQGARVLMQDFITHAPRTTDEDGTLTFATGRSEGVDNTLPRAQKALKANLERFVTDLQNLKDANGSVYDNSLILIYGDHANHVRPLPHADNTVDAEKYHSLAMVKYPHETNATKHETADVVNHDPNKPAVFNKPFYAPYINELLKDWEANKNPANQYNINSFVGNPKFTANFASDKQMIGFYSHEAAILQWNNGKLVIANTPTWNSQPSTTLVDGNKVNGWINYDDYKDWQVADRNATLLEPISWKVAP